VSTGLISLDEVLGPLEGIIEITGGESSGKTTLCYHILRRGGAYITSENDFDPTLAPSVVDKSDLYIVRPQFGEAALEAASLFLPGTVVIDSATMLRPAVSAGLPLWEEEQLGARDRMLAFGARLLKEACRDKGGVVVFTQQLRASIGKQFVKGTRVAGGRGIAVAADFRLALRRGGNLLRGHRTIGVCIHVDILRCGDETPGATVDLDLLYGSGFRRSSSLLDWSVRRGVVKRTGGWYRLGDTVLGQGRDATCTAIEGGLWEAILIETRRGTAWRGRQRPR
jgi:recombination protein RecA